MTDAKDQEQQLAPEQSDAAMQEVARKSYEQYSEALKQDAEVYIHVEFMLAQIKKVKGIDTEIGKLAIGLMALKDSAGIDP